jgi:ABC-type nitrate/sulfonate/bicarbonate transport system substrate-binding protein
MLLSRGSWPARGLLAGLMLGSAIFSAAAADHVNAGKAVGTQFAFLPLDIGVAEGFFAKEGLEVEITTMSGEAKLQQGLTAESLDIGLAGSPGAALAVKGAPVLAVAALSSAPRNFSVLVTADSPIRSIADLKDKLISGATTGGLPEWLIKRLSVAQGWGPAGIRTIAVGSPDASLAALRTHQVDAMMTSTALGYRLEEEKSGRIVTGMGDVVPHFHTEIVFARTGFIRDHPDQLRRFLKGLFASVAFIKANRDKTVAIGAPIIHQSPEVTGQTYGSEVSTLSDDGTFDPAAVSVLKQSFVEMGILAEQPRDEQILTTQFVPVKF